jgi:histidinol phosphatase-like enzyme
MKAIIFDRDGTIVFEPHGPTEADTAVTPDKLALLPHAVEGMKLLAAQGFSLFIMSNQDGIVAHNEQ